MLTSYIQYRSIELTEVSYVTVVKMLYYL